MIDNYPNQGSDSMYGRLGLGTFPFAGPFSTVTPDEVIAILDQYFTQGGEYLDTAPTYAFGAIETMLGEYLRTRDRHTFAISTSCGYIREGDGYRVSGRRDDVRRDLEETLERLQLSFVDIYISHIPDPDTPFEETAMALDELRSEGLAKRIGVSNVDAEQLRRYASAGEITVVQNRFSYLNRSLEPALLQTCEEIGAAVVAYQVIERGLLTNRGPSLVRDDDLRRKKPEFSDERVTRVRNFVEDQIVPIAQSAHTTVESLAIQWAMAQRSIGLVQVGATSRSQVERLPIGVPSLSSEVLEQMDRAYGGFEGEVLQAGFRSVRQFLGLADYDVRSGSASGR